MYKAGVSSGISLRTKRRKKRFLKKGMEEGGHVGRKRAGGSEIGLTSAGWDVTGDLENPAAFQGRKLLTCMMIKRHEEKGGEMVSPVHLLPFLLGGSVGKEGTALAFKAFGEEKKVFLRSLFLAKKVRLTSAGVREGEAQWRRGKIRD